MGYPKSSRAVDHFSIEIDTHGFGEPPFFEFKNPTSTFANTLTCSHESLLNHTLSDQHLVILVQFLRRRTKGELENVGKLLSLLEWGVSHQIVHWGRTWIRHKLMLHPT